MGFWTKGNEEWVVVHLQTVDTKGKRLCIAGGKCLIIEKVCCFPECVHVSVLLFSAFCEKRGWDVASQCESLVVLLCTSKVVAEV